MRFTCVLVVPVALIAAFTPTAMAAESVALFPVVLGTVATSPPALGEETRLPGAEQSRPSASLSAALLLQAGPEPGLQLVEASESRVLLRSAIGGDFEGRGVFGGGGSLPSRTAALFPVPVRSRSLPAMGSRIERLHDLPRRWRPASS